MARTTPQVHDDVLVRDDTERIAVGSPAWFAWLEQATMFAFVRPVGRFTARKEQGARGGAYWKAYRTHEGTLRRFYLGKSAELTVEWLHAAALSLAGAPPINPERSAANHDGGVPPQQEEPARQAAPIHLLGTKLFVPRPRADLVSRPRLHARLDAGLAGTLTLVCGPAGFGKTTLLADWLCHSKVLRQSPRAVAWLSLTAEDNDLYRFLPYLIAAFQTIAPSVGVTLLSLLHAPQPPLLPSLLTVLIADLAALPAESILILDDYHVIDVPAIDQAITFLLEHLPPRLHLVIASREDPSLPLARLRARRQLIELRAADLRFTTDEAAAFLNQVMGLPLSPADVAALEQRTEGWIAGLQLAALSMQNHKDLAGFIAAFTGSHRFILDYLIEEVIARQPDYVQAFLLQTSILDRLCGPLCDAVVTGPHSVSGQALLEYLERANLFLVPLDDERQWYRYHHLFADVLRQRLLTQRLPALFAGASGEAVATLHRRAAEWYDQQGFILEALHHASAAQDWGWAARLLEQHAELLLMRGELRTLHGWFQLLPRSVVRKQPRLLLAYAWAQFLAAPFHTDAVEAILHDMEAVPGLHGDQPTGQSVESGPLDGERAELRGKLAAVRASIANSQKDIPRTIALAHEALTYLPRDNMFWRLIPMVDLGLAYDASGEVMAASRAFTEAIDLAGLAGNRYVAMIATMHLARVRATQGELHVSAELHRRALAMAAEQGWKQLPMVALPHVWLGKLLYEWNDLPSATWHLLEGIKLVRPREQQRVLLEGYVTLAHVKKAQGDAVGALDAMRQAEEVAQTTDAPWAAPLIGAYKARLWLAQGRPDRAGRWLEEAGPRLNAELASQRELEFVTLARVRIAQGKAMEALPILERLLRATEAAGRLGSMIEILVLQALALQALDDPTRAIVVLQRALLLAEPEGYNRTFVDEGAPMATLLAQGLQDKHWNGSLRAYTAKLLASFPETELQAVRRLKPGSNMRKPAQAGSHSILNPLKRVSAFQTPTSVGGQERHGERSPVVSGQGTRSPALVEPLSPRELEVLALVADGKSNAEIAQLLVIAVSTVKAHLNTIFGKLDVTSRTQAIGRAHDLDLL